MNTILYGDTAIDNEKVYIVSTGGQTHTYNMSIREIVPISISNGPAANTVADEFSFDIYVRNTASYSSICVILPNGIETLPISASQAYNITKPDLQYNGSTYSINDGSFPITLKLFDNSGSLACTLTTNFTVFRATIDNLQITVPGVLPSANWRSSDRFIITADPTGDSISRIVIPPDIHQSSEITSSIQAHQWLDNNGYNLDESMSKVILEVDNSQDVTGTITITSTKGSQSIICPVSIKARPGSSDYIFDNIGYLYETLPDALKDSSHEMYPSVWYPVSVDQSIFDDFGIDSFTLYWSKTDPSGLYIVSDNSKELTDGVITKGIDTVYLSVSTAFSAGANVYVYVDGEFLDDPVHIAQPTYDVPSTDTGDYLSLGTYSGTPDAGSGFIWYPLDIDPSLYDDYSHKTSFTLYDTSGILQLHDGTGEISGHSIQISDRVTQVYVKIAENTAYKVRIVFDNSKPVFDYLNIPATSKISSTLLTNPTYGLTVYNYDNDSLPSDLTSKYPAGSGYVWVKMDIATSTINQYQSFKENDEYGCDILVAILDSGSNNITQAPSTSLPNDPSKVYHIQVPDNAVTDLILYKQGNNQSVNLGTIDTTH